MGSVQLCAAGLLRKNYTLGRCPERKSLRSFRDLGLEAQVQLPERTRQIPGVNKNIQAEFGRHTVLEGQLRVWRDVMVFARTLFTLVGGVA